MIEVDWQTTDITDRSGNTASIRYSAEDNTQVDHLAVGSQWDTFGFAKHHSGRTVTNTYAHTRSTTPSVSQTQFDRRNSIWLKSEHKHSASSALVSEHEWHNLTEYDGTFKI